MIFLGFSEIVQECYFTKFLNMSNNFFVIAAEKKICIEIARPDATIASCLYSYNLSFFLSIVLTLINLH